MPKPTRRHHQYHSGHLGIRASTLKEPAPPAPINPIPATPAAFATQTLGLDLDPVQTSLLASPAKYVILNCCRQWGKSTMAATKAAHQALTRPGSLTVVVSPGERQSAELVALIAKYLRLAGETVKRDGRFDASAVIPNGSRIIGLPAKEETTRGISSVSLLIVDEASRMSDALYFSFRPMLARSGGDIWILSTPNGCKGFFHKTWFSPDEEWTRITATAEDCPRISKRQLDRDRAEFADIYFRQEYMCEFGDPVTGLLRSAKIQALFSGKTCDLSIP